jgi:hydroxymethylglutaryl-CoA reductase
VEHLFQRNQRKLPIDILKKQQTIEKEMREKILMSKPLASNEAQEREAKIKAILANIPCMSPETLKEKRKKIEQQCDIRSKKHSG